MGLTHIQPEAAAGKTVKAVIAESYNNRLVMTFADDTYLSVVIERGCYGDSDSISFSDAVVLAAYAPNQLLSDADMVRLGFYTEEQVKRFRGRADEQLQARDQEYRRRMYNALKQEFEKEGGA